MINEPWYDDMASRYGEEFCRLAGYFDETKPFEGSYRDIFRLPQDDIILMYSGAFYPFHHGHQSIIRDAVESIEASHWVKPHVVVHADHAEYRQSKGSYDEGEFLKAFEILHNNPFGWTLVREDLMPNGCSRNFTRLYAELAEQNKFVYFLSGGDRANYALTFIDRGRCIIAGRDQHEMYQRYKGLENHPRIRFLRGNHAASSSEIRERQ